ncbi:hypothetical protein QOZ80_9BG0719130 [Eleusine coracana subsp. coracana]|nr:hypothetical protein QOZ80_9BG0719130 [Eleusine coracana subsp. coracana]
MNSTAMEQIGKYWDLWGSSTRRRSSDEPSWEEQAFARDAAAHLGGCVWPPRSYSCSFCQREFRSAQALGGHMNVHRRDRALLRQSSSSLEDGQEAHPVEQPQQQGPFFYRAASNPSSTIPAGANNKVDVNRATPPPSYLVSMIKESNNKLFMSILPASTTVRVVETTNHYCDHDDDVEAGRMKRRRLDPPSSVTLPIFVQTTVSLVATRGVDDHDSTKVSKAITSNPSSIPPLVDQQEVDLELRLGTTTPKVT